MGLKLQGQDVNSHWYEEEIKTNFTTEDSFTFFRFDTTNKQQKVFIGFDEIDVHVCGYVNDKIKHLSSYRRFYYSFLIFAINWFTLDNEM